MVLPSMLPKDRTISQCLKPLSKWMRFFSMLLKRGITSRKSTQNRKREGAGLEGIQGKKISPKNGNNYVEKQIYFFLPSECNKLLYYPVQNYNQSILKSIIYILHKTESGLAFSFLCNLFERFGIHLVCGEEK